ncbi:MAG: IPT/TIG domain-containing protein, partial [Deltaproteobacteria bacterium]|nr:IPT/TIG domain-containing protein [Deltaproteobacteria bacterium]
MKKIILGVVLVVSVVWVSDTEARRIKSKCGPDKVEVYNADAGGIVCEKRMPVVPQTPLVIQSIEPAIVKPGEQITIRGSGFAQNKISAIRFSYGGEVNQFSVVSPNEIKVTVPDSTRSGAIQLLPNYNLQLNSPTSSQILKILPELKITKVEPPQGRWTDYVKVYQTRVGNEGWDTCHVIFGGIDLGLYNLNHYKSGDPLGMNVPKEVKNNEIVIACSGNGARATSGNMFSFIAPKPTSTPASQPIAQPTPPPAPEKITKNAAGETEYCFGAVGKGCGGFGQLKGEEASGNTAITAGCSGEANGQRNCWVVPGSIKHDNCCVKNPYGKWCG